MEYLWIYASAGAALCQALRYAALKELNRHLSTLVATYVRILFGLPLHAAYMGVLLWAMQAPIPAMSSWFLFCSAVTAVGQFSSTALMMRLFQIGNFAVGTMLVRSEVILAALIGTAFFSEVVSGVGWLALCVTVLGVLVTSAGRVPAGAWMAGGSGPLATIFGRSTQIGLLAGLINATCFLLLREAILALDPALPAIVRAAWAGLVMTGFSAAILGSWLLLTEREGLKRIVHFQGYGWFLGVMSAIGTILWFGATAFTNASYVAAVAQVQVVFALALSRYWFGERIRPLELAGIALILAGVLMFKLA